MDDWSINLLVHLLLGVAFSAVLHEVDECSIELYKEVNLFPSFKQILHYSFFSINTRICGC